MNPGKLNHRIKFYQLTNTVSASGGNTPSLTEILTTWGSLEPVRQYNQLAIEAGASVLNGDKQLIIRKRDSFMPEKDMVFDDLNNPGDSFTVHAILPYWEGTSAKFQNTQSAVYHDNYYWFIVGVKRS
jgi:SPP1 family predicted phage head-tail adaptor